VSTQSSLGSLGWQAINHLHSIDKTRKVLSITSDTAGKAEKWVSSSHTVIHNQGCVK
jgi:hypothetical protein